MPEFNSKTTRSKEELIPILQDLFQHILYNRFELFQEVIQKNQLTAKELATPHLFYARGSKDKSEKDILTCAVMKQKQNFVEFLLENFDELREINETLEANPISQAIECENAKMLDYLLFETTYSKDALDMAENSFKLRMDNLNDLCKLNPTAANERATGLKNLSITFFRAKDAINRPKGSPPISHNQTTHEVSEGKGKEKEDRSENSYGR